ncbi:MAG: hypothetical protein U0174_20255 [Polyangiaceae bacterium]
MRISCWSSVLLGLAVALAGACSIATSTDGETTGKVQGGILVGSAGILGIPAEVRLHRTREVPTPCEPSGKGADCTKLENIPGRFVSLSCAPEAACEVTMKETELATILPLAETFTIRVKAEFEGKVESVDQPFKAGRPPGGKLSLQPLPKTSIYDEGPDAYFEGSDVSACMSPEANPLYALVFEQDGRELPSKEERGRGPGCRFATLGAGKVKVSTVLVKPRVVLEAREIDVLPHSAVTELVGGLAYEESAPGATPQFIVRGYLRGRATGGGLGFIGNSVLRIEGGGVERLPLPESATGYASNENLVHLSARPDATFRMYVQAGTRRLDVKLTGLP